MHRLTKRLRWTIPAALALTALLHGAVLPAQTETRVSRFGEYRGYSQPVYDGWKRSSFFISARDGAPAPGAASSYMPSHAMCAPIGP